MKQIAYGKPLFINSYDKVISLNKIEALDEISVQDLIFNHPECLPISDIDEALNPIIPVCKELNTTFGALDGYFGHIVSGISGHIVRLSTSSKLNALSARGYLLWIYFDHSDQ